MSKILHEIRLLCVYESIVYLEFKLTEHRMFLFAKFGNSRWGDFRQDDGGTA